MKKLFLFCFAACLSVVVSAQKVFFMYLQTDDYAPFYVRMGDKIYSSSATGYLIIPNLADSTYRLGLGFARSTQPETRFAVTINQNDKGYLIKNFSEGLSLFDLQDLSIVKAVSATASNTVYETRTDKFSSVLAKAADDPSLLKVPVAKKEEPKPKEVEKEVTTVKVEEVKPSAEELKDTVVVQNTTPVDTIAATIPPAVAAEVKEPVLNTEEEKKPEVKEEPANTGEPRVEYKRSTIIRRSESSTTEGFGIVFYDQMADRTDTIRILIPPSKSKIINDSPVANKEEERKADVPISNEELRGEDQKPAPTEPVVNESTDEPKQPAIPANNCKDLASDKDFMKLRKNMAAEENDEAMIDEARKVFRNKCFSVEQVRYLSTLFLTSAAKYQFFDAAYNYVSDKHTFSSLQSEIKDEYYLKRFKALVGE